VLEGDIMSMSTAIGTLLRTRAAATPNLAFLQIGDDVFTFAALDERTDRVAAGFAALGVAKGDRVAIVAMNRPEMLELYFGLAKLGAIQVPLNAFLKGEFLRYQLAQSEARVLVVDSAAALAAAPLVDELPNLETVVTLDDQDSALAAVRRRTVAYRELAATTGRVPDVEVGPDDVMSIVYTSGTTGLPKGCVLSHGYYLRVGSVMNRTHELTEQDVLLTALPLFHGAARMMVVASGLLRGIPVVIEPEFSASRFFERAAATGATVAYGVGAMGIALLATPASDADRAHGLRTIMLVPFAADDQGAFRARFGVDVWAEGFGQTECVPISWNSLSGPRRRDASGRPGDDLDVAVLDDRDEPVPTGAVGEICVRPRHRHAMFEGYWRMPDETLRAFRTLWYHTGDLGRLDADGSLCFVDRKKDALRRRGENVSSLELEAAIARHPGIVEAAVHAVPSEATEDDIKACIVLTAPDSVEPRELFDFFTANLPYFAIPRYVEVVNALPKNAVGRVMKFQLKDRVQVGPVWDLDDLGLTITKAERR
jgi:crotonobetaine/carnitine-CoA ligase